MKPGKKNNLLKNVILIILFSIIIIILTNLTLKLSSITSATTASFCFLITVLLSAFFGNLAVAVIISLIATISFDYNYLNPVGKLTIAALPDLVVLFTFLLTSIIISHLTSSAADNASVIKQYRFTSKKLKKFTEWLTETTDQQLTLSEIAQKTLNIFNLDYCAIHIYAEGKWYHFTGSAKHNISNVIEKVDVRRIRDHMTNIEELADESILEVRYAQVDIKEKPFALIAIKSNFLPAYTTELIARLISLRLKESK